MSAIAVPVPIIPTFQTPKVTTTTINNNLPYVPPAFSANRMNSVPVEVYPSNIVPRNNLSPTILKIWQRLCVAYAVFETLEINKSNTAMNKYVYCQEAYRRYANTFVTKYEKLIPVDLTTEILCRANLTKSQVLNGSQIWYSIWEPLNRRIRNTFLPEWSKIVAKYEAKNEAHKIDDMLHALRKKLWEIEHAPNADAASIAPATSVDSSNMSVLLSAMESTISNNANNGGNQSCDDSVVTGAAGGNDDDANSLDGASSELQARARESILQLLQIGNALAGANSLSSPLLAAKTEAPTTGAAVSTRKKTFKEDWYPMEWMVFVTFGPFSAQAFPGWLPASTTVSANNTASQTTNLLNLLADSALHSASGSASPVDSKLVGSKRDRESLEASSTTERIVVEKRARTISCENQVEDASSMETMVIDESSSLFILDSSHTADAEIEVEVDQKPSLSYPAPFPMHFEVNSDNIGDEKIKVYLQRSLTSQEEFNRLYKVDLQMKRLIKLIEIFANDSEKQAKYLQELERIQIM